jgi:hypothetical protein
VSCPTVVFCVAVGSRLDAALNSRSLVEFWNGTRWRLDGAVPALDGSDLTDVDCPSRRFCAAVGCDDSGGVLLTWNGALWRRHTVAPAVGFELRLDDGGLLLLGGLLHRGRE